jgi:hypothetical protein
MISQVKQNECIHSHMDLADPSHPSSNPLILEMSRSAGCEATGRWALIRKMAGSAASRATGDRKSKEKWHNTVSYHSFHANSGLAILWYLSTWVPTWVICMYTITLGAPPAHHCWVLGDLWPWPDLLDRESSPLSISQSRPVPWG